MPTEYDLAYRQSGTGLPYRNIPTSPQVKVIRQQPPTATPQQQPTDQLAGGIDTQLKDISEGKDTIHTVNISTREYSRKGNQVFEFTGTTDAGGRYANEYASGDVLLSDRGGSRIYTTKEEAIKNFVNNARSKFGLNETDRILVDGKVYQESSFTPDQFAIAKGVSSGALSFEQAQVNALRSQREQLKSNFGGSFTPSNLAMATAPVGTNVSREIRGAATDYKQIALKKSMLEKSQQWASVKDYEDKFARTSGFIPITQQKEIYTPESYKTQPAQFDNKIIPAPSHDDLVRYDALRIKAGAEQGSVYVDRFGKMVPRKETQDIFEKGMVEKGIVPSAFTLGIAKTGKEYADKYRRITEDKDPVIGTFREAAAITLETTAMLPASFEIMGKTVLKDPLALPGMVAYAGVKTGEGMGEQIQKSPGQFLATVAVGSAVFGGGIKSAGVIGQPVVSAGRTVASTVKNVRPRIVQTTEPYAVPGIGILTKPKYKIQITEAQQAALDRGALFGKERYTESLKGSERNVEGYRPSGQPKPENIFTSGYKSQPTQIKQTPIIETKPEMPAKYIDDTWLAEQNKIATEYYSKNPPSVNLGTGSPESMTRLAIKTEPSPQRLRPVQELESPYVLRGLMDLKKTPQEIRQTIQETESQLHGSSKYVEWKLPEEVTKINTENEFLGIDTIGKYRVVDSTLESEIVDYFAAVKPSQKTKGVQVTKTKQVQSTQPSFAEYSAITGAQAAAQIQRTRQITGQLTGQQTKHRQITGLLSGQQTKQVQDTTQLTGLKSLNITAQLTKQKTDTEQIVTPVSVYKTAQVQTPVAIQIPAMDTILIPKATTRQTPRTTTPTTTTPTTRTPTKRPPKQPPKYPKIISDDDDIFPGTGRTTEKKGKKTIQKKKKGTDFWFPASYESVTKEELSLGGRRATHIGKQEKKKTSTLYGKKIVTRGRPIPTKRQFKASDLL